MAEWVTVCLATDISGGQREVFGINDRWIAVFNVSDKYYAIEDLCTHDGNVLTFDRYDNPSKLIGVEIECPRHGGRFDIRNGQATRSPADIDVPWFDVQVIDGNIQILV
jgi:3-phenylpropionate/trans-cinnamate dioxygenase ferredoxin component